MIIKDVWHTYQFNMLLIRCDCDTQFIWPSRISTIECPICKRREYWHDFNGDKDYPVAKNEVSP